MTKENSVKSFEYYKNNKTGGIYFVQLANIINTTNANDGQIMVKYVAVGERQWFVREIEEFKQKFTPTEYTEGF